MPRHSLILATLLTLAAGPAAQAGSTTVMVYGFAPTLGSTTVQRQILVNYEPVAAGDASGADALLARISAAADKVCTPDISSALLNSKISKCRRAAVERAVQTIGSPVLSEAANRS